MTPQELLALAELETPEGVAAVLDYVKPMRDGRGWALVKAVLEGQLQHRKAAVILAPLGTEPNAVYAQEYMKGEISGVRTMLSIVDGLIEAAEEAKRELDQQEAEANAGTSDAE